MDFFISIVVYVIVIVFSCANPVERVSHIVDLNLVLICLNEEKVISELESLIGEIINTFNILFTKGVNIIITIV